MRPETEPPDHGSNLQVVALRAVVWWVVALAAGGATHALRVHLRPTAATEATAETRASPPSRPVPVPAPTTCPEDLVLRATADRVRDLRERLEPAAAAEGETLEPAVFQGACARLEARILSTDCAASPCVAVMEGGAPAALREALVAELPEDAWVAQVNLDGRTVLAAWPERPEEAVVTAGLQRAQSALLAAP